MAQAFRKLNNKASFVPDGIDGQVLSKSHREFRRGFRDSADHNTTIEVHPSSAYKAGVDTQVREVYSLSKL